MSLAQIGAVCFGVVIGWVTYRTIRRSKAPVGPSDITTVIGAVGGAATTALFMGGMLFGLYAIGLAGGFFGYFILGLIVSKGNLADALMLQSLD